jgi:hypothetical protein
MTSRLAKCMYPNLAEQDAQRQTAAKPTEVKGKSWWDTGPRWDSPRPAPAPDYSKVPGLRRK